MSFRPHISEIISSTDAHAHPRVLDRSRIGMRGFSGHTSRSVSWSFSRPGILIIVCEHYLDARG